MPESWRQSILESVSPLTDGARDLRVDVLRDERSSRYRPARTAAVLVGILDRDDPEILLTRRAGHLAHHPGQISFPGGAAEPDGESGVTTALREAREEIGLHPEAVRPVGFLDRIDTVSDYRVLPVVGLVSQCGPFVPDGNEVDLVFSVPLRHVLDLDAYRESTFGPPGQRRLVYHLDWKGHDIWGITAAILRNLAERVQE